MKQIHTILLSLLAVTALASCETQNESGSSSNGTGTLELGVSVTEPTSVTRAVSTDDFPVTITGTSTDVADVALSYNAVSELPASITLNVGTYTVAAHTPGTMAQQMTTPYYSGSTEMTITRDITTQTTVTCKMKNSRIQLVYTDAFTSAFSTWNITITDGANMALAYDETTDVSNPIYWAFTENTVSSITVNIKAVTAEGNTVSESRKFTKSNATTLYTDVDTDYFAGGEALVISMGAVNSSIGNVNGITINTNITFEDTGETVEIPTKDEKETNPDEGGDETAAVTLTCVGKTNADATTDENLFETGISFSTSGKNWPEETNVVISTPNGLQSIKVTIQGGNDNFQQAVDLIGFSERELIGDTELVNTLKNFGIALSLPETGATTYTFPIHQFYVLMNLYGKTDEGKAHQFTINVTDQEGNSSSATLSVTITE